LEVDLIIVMDRPITKPGNLFPRNIHG
jgi:hypothetical protein